MFAIGDYAVCPGDGVGQVCDIEDKEIAGENISFYKVKIISNGMTVMVPTNSTAGIRTLVEDDEISEVYNLLNNHDIHVDNSTWNRRNRDYLAKIKTGSIIEIADVLRALFLLKERKNLSFGEKKLLEQCRDMIAEEISLSGGNHTKEVKAKINSCFQ